MTVTDLGAITQSQKTIRVSASHGRRDRQSDVF